MGRSSKIIQLLVLQHPHPHQTFNEKRQTTFEPRVGIPWASLAYCDRILYTEYVWLMVDGGWWMVDGGWWSHGRRSKLQASRSSVWCCFMYGLMIPPFTNRGLCLFLVSTTTTPHTVLLLGKKRQWTVKCQNSFELIIYNKTLYFTVGLTMLIGVDQSLLSLLLLANARPWNSIIHEEHRSNSL